MKKYTFTIATLVALLISSCTETPKQDYSETTTEIVEKKADDIVASTSIDKEGRKLELYFNNSNGTATLNFEGETIELVQQRSASGIWYKNETYELRGKGNDVELKKAGKVIFVHNDDIVSTSLKNKEGQTLDIIFNNTTNQAKIYLNGGEQVDLIGQKPNTGLWYKNEQYELRGNGEVTELIKNGKTIFKKSK